MVRKHKPKVLLALLSIAGMVVVFLLQRQDMAVLMGVEENIWRFIFNRSLRFIINDVLAIILIYALFVERKYVMFAIGVQVFGLLFVLLPYFILKFHYASYNGPLISFLHRLILNPTLILLLIPAFYYQRSTTR